MNEFAKQDSYSSYLMLCNIHAAYKFRRQHWSMVRRYIMDNTKYPRATGGTPITTWLPNQIGACLEMCREFMDVIKVEDLSAKDAEDYKVLRDEINTEIDRLFKEVLALQTEFNDANQDVSDFQTRERA